MSTTARRNPETLPAGAGPNAWLAFAAVVLFLNGCFSAFWGLTALLNDEVLRVGGRGVIVADFTTWGWVTLIIGCVMIATSIGLFVGRGAARWLAVVFVTLNAMTQFATASAFPLWSLLVVALDVVILYQLFARWQLTE